MKYYLLTSIGVDRKEIGRYPQSIEGFAGDIQQDFIPSEGFIDFDFRLPVPKLHDKAKPTTLLDVVMISGNFLVLKNYFIEFLQDFNIGQYQSHRIKVVHRKSIINDYSLFRLIHSKQHKYVDFNKSEFYIGKIDDYKYIGDPIKVTDYENYLNTREILKEDNLWLKCRKVVLNLSEAKEDMFRLYIDFAFGYYISERLKNAIEEKKFTGMAIKNITDSRKRVEVIY